MNQSTTKHATPHHIGVPLQIVRQSLGITQRDLARAAGVSTGYLGLVEEGARVPDPIWTERVARVLRFTVAARQSSTTRKEA